MPHSLKYLFALVLLACVAPSVSAQEVPLDAGSVRATVLAETNAYRASKNIPQLKANAALEAAATAYAVYIAEHEKMGHTADGKIPPNASPPRDTSRASSRRTSGVLFAIRKRRWPRNSRAKPWTAGRHRPAITPISSKNRRMRSVSGRRAGSWMADRRSSASCRCLRRNALASGNPSRQLAERWLPRWVACADRSAPDSGFLSHRLHRVAP